MPYVYSAHDNSRTSDIFRSLSDQFCACAIRMSGPLTGNGNKAPMSSWNWDWRWTREYIYYLWFIYILSLVEPEVKKRSLTVQTVKKWVLDNEKILDTSTWLTYDTSKSDRTIVTSLKCSVCIRFEQKLRGQRNFNAAFIVGSTNLISSSFKDHAATDMHAHAMLLYKKAFLIALLTIRYC